MIVKYFQSRHEAISILKKDIENWQMTLRNTMYGKILGFYDDDELVACVSLSIYDDELYIYTFEVAKYLQGEGYGKQCFNIILDMFKDQINKVSLNYLDNTAESFWKHLGFKNVENGDSDESMELIL